MAFLISTLFREQRCLGDDMGDDGRRYANAGRIRPLPWRPSSDSRYAGERAIWASRAFLLYGDNGAWTSITSPGCGTSVSGRRKQRRKEGEEGERRRKKRRRRKGEGGRKVTNAGDNAVARVSSSFALRRSLLFSHFYPSFFSLFAVPYSGRLAAGGLTRSSKPPQHLLLPLQLLPAYPCLHTPLPAHLLPVPTLRMLRAPRGDDDRCFDDDDLIRWCGGDGDTPDEW